MSYNTPNMRPPQPLCWAPQRREGTRAMTGNNLSRWLMIPRPNPNASVRLFCFPYAGGNASIYTSWSRDLSANVELVAVQPPGRANRISEPPHSRMQDLIADLCPAIRALLGKPYILLGHSLGSHVAFELARELRRR